MNGVSLASWNSENALGDPSRVREATEQITRLDADLIYVPETAIVGHGEVGQLDEAQERLRTNGYDLIKLTEYYDGNVPFGHETHTMSMWSRVSSAQSEVAVTGNRRSIVGKVNDLEVVGTHPEDYRESERIQTARSVVDLLSNREGDPQVIMGDFNAMESKDLRSYPLRLVRLLTELGRTSLGERLEYYGDGNGVKGRFENLASLGIRFADMSAGTSMDIYNQAGFKNADPSMRWPKPTIGFGRGGQPIAKIDHIVGRNVRFESFNVHQTSLSDHCALSARVLW